MPLEKIAAMVKRLRGITLTANITEVTRDAADALESQAVEIARLTAENAALSAWQCVFEDGKAGIVYDEYGNQYCQMARRAQAGVTVKPLVWRQQSRDCHVAHTALGDTAVQNESHALAPDRWGWWSAGSAEDDSPSGYAVTIEAAKAAAQADYEARILSALEPTPTPLPEVVMRERAAVAADSHARYSEAAILATPALVALDHIHDITSSRLARKIGESIRALPTTATHAELLDAAAQLPEVKMLVDAATDTIAWDKSRGFIVPYRVRDPIFKALAPFTRKGE